MKKLVTILVVISFTSCVSKKINTTVGESDATKISYAPLWGAVYMQKASEYKALCLQAYNIAFEKLDSYVRQSSSKPFAVITDIDETVLDNSPYTVHQALKAAQYSDDSWKEWTAKTDCDTVPGALSFFKYASSKNVEVYYISNRLQAEASQTVANLKKWGFPNADEAHLLLKTTSSSKDARRASVKEKYNVLLYFGDNLGDFSGIFDHQSNEQRDALVKQNVNEFGSRFIVLPNAMYGEWQGALLRYNYKLSQKEQKDTIENSLKKY